MANTAIVALGNSDGTYDVFYSHDGAYRLQLYPLLQVVSGSVSHPDFADVLDRMQSPSMEQGTERREQMDRLQEGMARRSNHPINTAEYEKLLESDPVATGVPAANLTEHVLPNREMVYVVEDNWCRVFETVWLSLDLLAWLRNHAEIELYERASLQSLKQLDVLQDRRPRHTFSGEDFRRIALSPENNRREYEALQQTYQFVGEELLAIAKSNNQRNSDKTSTIISDDWIFKSKLSADADADELMTATLLKEIPIYNMGGDDEIDALISSSKLRTQELILPITTECSFGELSQETAIHQVMTDLWEEFGEDIDNPFLTTELREVLRTVRGEST